MPPSPLPLLSSSRSPNDLKNPTAHDNDHENDNDRESSIVHWVESSQSYHTLNYAHPYDSDNENENDNENEIGDTGNENAKGKGILHGEHKKSDKDKGPSSSSSSLTSLSASPPSVDPNVNVPLNSDIFPPPQDSVSIFSFIFVNWLTPLLLTGSKRRLELSDVYQCCQSDTTEKGWEEFEPLYLAHCKEREEKIKNINSNIPNENKETPPGDSDSSVSVTSTVKLMPIFVSLFWKEFLLSAFFFIFVNSDQLLAPFFLENLVTWLAYHNYDGESDFSGYRWTICIFISASMAGICRCLSMNLMIKIGVRLRNILIRAIFQKSLMLSLQLKSDGKISNLFSSDTQRIVDCCQSIHNLWVAPIILIVGTIELYYQVGWAALAGLAVMIFCMPVAGILSAKQIIYQKKFADATDVRIKLINEVLQSIRIIKFYNWEMAFLDMINESRRVETEYLRTFVSLKSATIAALLLTPLIGSLVVFIIYAGTGGAMTASTVFTTITLLLVIKWPFTMAPMAIMQFTQFLVAVKRIEEFLSTPNIIDNREVVKRHHAEMRGGEIRIHGAEFTWNKDGHEELRKQFLAEIKRKEEEEKMKKMKNSKGKEKGKDTGVEKGENKEEKKGEGKGSEDSVSVSVLVSTDENKKSDKEVPSLSTTASLITEFQPTSTRPILSNINLTISSGELLAVVSPVGKGKSSLLYGILGECFLNTGSVSVIGSIGHVPQSAFIINASFKENILFGSPYDALRYQQVVFACCLQSDFDQFPAGDETEIGERGINISGGQQQRCSLARAAYSQISNIVLLDDPLSAVDYNVAVSLWDRLIGPNGLWAKEGKTRILCTHALQFLQQADRILMLGSVDDKEEEKKDVSTIKAMGKYDELITQSDKFQEMMRSFHRGREEMKGEKEKDTEKGKGSGNASEDGDQQGTPKDDETHHILPSSSTSLIKQSSASITKPSTHDPVEAPTDTTKSRTIRNAQGHLVEQEERQEGEVSSAVYIGYLKAFGSWPFIFSLFVFGYIGSQALQNASDIWLSLWTNDITDGTPKYSVASYLLVYGGLVLGVSIFTFGRTLANAYGGVHASYSLHDSITQNVLKRKMSWFDTTPTGRILNRFTKDIYLIDNVIAVFAEWTISIVAGLIGGVIVCCILLPIILAVFGPLFILYVTIANYYRRSSRELQRLESISRSPLFVHFGEMLSGLVTIRAMDMSALYLAESAKKANRNSSCMYISNLASFWVRVRLEMIGAVISVSCALLGIAMNLGPGPYGLLLTYAFNMSGSLNWAILLLTLFESNMNSVERILFICNPMKEDMEESDGDAEREEKEAKVLEGYQVVISRKGKSNGDRGINSAKNAKDSQSSPSTHDELKSLTTPLSISSSPSSRQWPSAGSIEFRSYSMRYRPGLPLVIKSVSFSIVGGQKVGLCGRTGSSKSSLLMCLFRMVEAAEGGIFIDGIDISKISLSVLRSSLSIIPQEPTLFMTTIRKNVDPFDEYTDQEIWTSLEYVQLKGIIERYPMKLSTAVAESGTNLSVGQKQLLCLSRALLRKSKIICADEATASVDVQTDEIIQQVINTQFRNNTVLTIAHRLNTIINSDMVLVMDKGRVGEFAPPHVLMKNPQSKFQQMLLAAETEAQKKTTTTTTKK